MTRHYRLAGAAVVGALLVAGCSDGAPIAEASVAPTLASPTASPSPSATAVVVAPQRPAEMADQGRSGAEAAAAYFFQLDNYAQSTGDTEELVLMSHPTCEPCAERIEQAQSITAAGDSFTGGEITTRVIESYLQDPATGIWPLDLELSENETVVTGPDGSIVYQADASTFTKRIEVALRDGQWVVFAVGPIPEN